jgi:hypothetical protein
MDPTPIKIAPMIDRYLISRLKQINNMHRLPQSSMLSISIFLSNAEANFMTFGRHSPSAIQRRQLIEERQDPINPLFRSFTQ